MGQWTQGIGQRRLWKAEEFDGRKPTTYDWCRMAAFMDGEGTIDINTCSAAKPRYIVRVLIGNTNPNLMVWLRSTFGGNVIFRRVKNPNAKHTYVWSCTAGRAAWILYNCLPWFLLKGAQAELMMELQGHIDQTKQGRNRELPASAFEYRLGIKTKLRELNARGREAQKEIVSVEEINRG